MGAGPSGQEVKEAGDVKILNDCIYIDHSTRQQRHAQLAQDALHSTRRGKLASAAKDDLDMLQEALEDIRGGGTSFLCTAPQPSVRLAADILSRALEMLKVVGEEPQDVHDEDWRGPEGRDPMTVLYDTHNPREIAEGLMELARGVQVIVSKEKRIQQVAAPATIFGDLHGQFRDMLLLFFDFGVPHANGEQFVFNGDWVDRGRHQIEVITMVFALKLAFPQKVFLNRGNHEDAGMNERYGFKDQCLERLGNQDGHEAFETVTRAFTYLPLGSRVSGRVLVVHGGIGNGDWDLKDVEEASNPLTAADMSGGRNGIAQNIMWSDPIPEDNRGDVRGVHKSPRSSGDVIKTFGYDVTRRFLERNGLQLVIRSHEFVEGGHGYEVEHGGRLVRVFSARDYQGDCHNGGAVVHLGLSDGVLEVQPQVLIALGKSRP